MNIMSRIYYAYPERSEQADTNLAGWWASTCERASALGFQSILMPPLWSTADGERHGAPDDPDRSPARWSGSESMVETVAAMAATCRRHKLFFLMDLVLDKAMTGGALAQAHPEWYEQAGGPVLDPRNDLQIGLLRARLRNGQADAGLVAWWGARLQDWANAGLDGFRCLAPTGLSPSNWTSLIAQVHAQSPECCFMAWTPGLTPAQIASLAPVGFEATFLSLPWWDYRSSWLVEEHSRLRIDAAVIAPLEDPENGPADGATWRTQEREEARRTLWTAAFVGDGILMPMGFEEIAGKESVTETNKWIAQRPAPLGPLRLLSGPLADVTALFRDGSAAKLFLINPDSVAPAQVDWHALRSRLPNSYTVNDRIAHEFPEVLQPADCSLVSAVPAAAVKAAANSSGDQRKTIAAAVRAPRVAIENISPSVDHGRFPIKRTIGDMVQVQADVLMDGHDYVAVRLVWRAADETQWHSVPMEEWGNDRWQGEFSPDRIGRHSYGVQAWLDVWRSYRGQLQKKSSAGQDVSLEVEEGRLLISAALDRARDDMPFTANVLISTLDAIGRPQSAASRPRPRRARAPDSTPGGDMAVTTVVPKCDPGQVQVLLSEEVADAMEAADDRPFEVSSDIVYPLMVERREARFASWYELFPRSQSARPGAHGTFLDVIERLPAIRDMGFDVLYFPPIHPIGLRNRKGKNNSLNAGPDDPGSPYAIGSPEGGHDAVHPQLGSLDDFRELIRAAHGHGLEIAMDFAIQCSPDHPWLADRPEWFDWRADGSLRYAENPPKRYEDIVNPDFYSPLASAPQQAGLWRALRDVVLFWVDQGVQTFRVDNPHTKPLPFWQWLISEVQGLHPQTVFLSEAFTRPKMMYRLAKVGFSQSYTYFTWRNGKQEITDYLTELNTAPVADFFRPNFFVNTPDINPYFLQDSGRPGFLIRAALACTTSGLWGMYNGFELCEARPVPGKEEYQDSEKYEIRSWDWDRPGNIVAEITRLNQMRRMNPALQSHLGIRFHNVDNGQILFFSKTTPERDNIVLVAISLDPHARQTGMLELPLWQWDLPDDGTVPLQDLFDDRRFTLHGKYHHVELTQERPFLVWRLVHPA